MVVTFSSSALTFWAWAGSSCKLGPWITSSTGGGRAEAHDLIDDVGWLEGEAEWLPAASSGASPSLSDFASSHEPSSSR